MTQQTTKELERAKKGAKAKTISGAQPNRPTPAVNQGGAIDLDDLTPAGTAAQALLYETTRGRVAGYSVTSSGLIIHLDCSAIFRISISVDGDEPHFRSAVSMAMVALNNRIAPSTSTENDQQYLWARLEKASKGATVRRAFGVALSYSTDSDPFDHESFNFTPVV